MLGLTIRRNIIKKLSLVVAALAALGVAGSVALADGSEPPPNWHIHDGQLALGPQHKGISFFPAILGLTTSEYLKDPAMCPDATDKSLLPNGKNENQPLRAGQCQTSTTIIGIDTPVAAHTHRGTALSTGPVIVALGKHFKPVGCAAISEDAALAIGACNCGGIYVDVHTKKFPKGAIRGTLEPRR